MERREFINNGAMAVCTLPFIGCFNRHSVHINNSLNPDIHNFKIGKFQCSIFRDIMWNYEAGQFFVNAKEEELKQSLAKYNISPENIPSPFIALLLQYGDRKILVDTGIGFSESPITYKGEEVLIQGKLTQLLNLEGIKLEEITDVVLTHFHPDHIGGVFSAEGKLNFPNAKFHVHEDEWSFWHSAKADPMPPMFKSFVKNNVTPLSAYDLELVKGDSKEIIPGITMINATGHTPGHVALVLTHKSEKLMYSSDAFLHPLHIERLDWQTIFDYDHTKAKKTRIKLLDMAYREDMIVNSFHFNFPGLGKVEKLKNNWLWNYNES
jgi:glyoxylase-like metal-dependent hydrolase (beta-lactamase superfamily II)